MRPNQSTRKDLLNYLLLGLFLYVAFLPLSSFLFALKNDALTDNFPNKYFFSAALRSGYLPLWNPYLNFGLPLYADPGFAFWHPVTWIFGLTGYNVHTLSIEILVYIWMGGIFMYELGRYFRHNTLTCFNMGIMYMCCGFFIGNIQHINFLTCAAFLPLVTKTFLQLQEAFSYKRLLFCTVSLYLLSAGGHPAIPIATVYFLAILLVGLLFMRNDDGTKISLSGSAKSNLLLIVCYIGTAAPLLFSWYEIFPYFNRSSPVHQQENLNLGFSIPSYISFLFPFSATADENFFSNDPLMRNGYFSFPGLALFIVAVLQREKKIQVIFTITGVAMLLLSLGGAVKEFLYAHLPLLQYVRTNGEYRVFSLFSFIIAGSFPLNKLLTGKDSFTFNKILATLSGICIFTIAWVSFHPFKTKILSANVSNPAASFSDKIKWWLDNWTLYDRLLVNAVILLTLLLLYFLLKRKIRMRWLLPGIIVADLVIFCWMHLGVTGVQRKSPADIESYFSSVPPGIPVPSLSLIKENTRPGEDLDKITGCWSYYSKQPGTPELCDYPTLFVSTENYFCSPLPPFINQHPFVFPKKGSSSPFPSLSVKKFSPSEIIVEMVSGANDTLILLQNYYPRWKAFVNDQPAEVQKEYISFMAVRLPDGKNEVRFHFQNKTLYLYLLVAFLTLTVTILLATHEKKEAG